MQLQLNSLRPFVGAKDYEASKAFYKEIGFEEVVIDGNLSLFKNGVYSFYLQNYYAKEWLENTMLFLEVDNADQTFNDLNESRLTTKFPGVKVMPLKEEPWGKVCHVIDPAGVLLHFAQFNK